MPTDGGRSKGGLAGDISISIVLVILFLLMLELCLRFAGIKYDASFYRPDRELGYVLRPSAEGWSVQERENYERISSQGLRDREHSVQRPPDVIRIALIGDSYAEAKQVDLDTAYWSVMERELNERFAKDGRRVEVLNFGVAGYSLAQEYLVIKDKVWQYDPQIIVLTGTLHSLVLNSSRQFAKVTSITSPPYFVRRNGRLVLDDASEAQRRAFVPATHLDEIVDDLSNSSRLLSLINASRRKVAADVAVLRSLVHGAAAAPAEGDVDYENLVLRGPDNPDLAEAWAVSEDLIRLSQAEAARHGAEFWFFLLDMAPQVDPDPKRREAQERALGIDDLFVADRLFADFARHEGILHAMLAPRMLAYAEKNGVVLHGFPHRPRNTGHWNIMGHRVAGDLMAEVLLNCSPTIRANREPSADLDRSICDDGSSRRN
jgi:hypothetical protein